MELLQLRMLRDLILLERFPFFLGSLFRGFGKYFGNVGRRRRCVALAGQGRQPQSPDRAAAAIVLLQPKRQPALLAISDRLSKQKAGLMRLMKLRIDGPAVLGIVVDRS